MRILLNERGEGYVAPASDLERAFLELCRAAGLEEPEKQVNVGDEESWIARVDFAYPRVKLLIELDGRRNHSALLDADADRRKGHRLIAAGWKVVRFTWGDLKERPSEVIATLRQLLAAAAS
ncbi:MAG: endonuclease domain-containing protein [Actinomycetota bacterium]|nr:endonuclease domain-containing protein [Actinomycetota bacterium]